MIAQSVGAQKRSEGAQKQSEGAQKESEGAQKQSEGAQKQSVGAQKQSEGVQPNKRNQTSLRLGKNLSRIQSGSALCISGRIKHVKFLTPALQGF